MKQYWVCRRHDIICVWAASVEEAIATTEGAVEEVWEVGTVPIVERKVA